MTCFRILLFILCSCILLCIMYHMCILYLIFVKIKNKICLRTLDRFFQIQNLSSIVVYNLHDNIQPTTLMDRRYRDRMVVGFTTTYAISAYHHWCSEFESRSERGIQHYVIKFVSDLRQVGGVLQVLWFPPAIKLTATI